MTFVLVWLRLSGSQESSFGVIVRRMLIPSTRHGTTTSSESSPHGISGVFPLITLLRNRMRDSVNESVRNPYTAAGGMTLSLLILVQRMQRRLIFSSAQCVFDNGGAGRAVHTVDA